MNTRPNIALLCNNKMALPAMLQLATQGLLCGIATANKDNEVIQLFRSKAGELGLPYTKISYKNYNAELQEWIIQTQADMVLVMTFPWRIGTPTLRMPEFGFLNFHYGLLPEMRGADPIFESIRQGKPTTGVTIHLMNEGFDTGDIVMQQQVALAPSLTYGLLSSQLAQLGERMCVQLIQDIKENKALPLQPQDEANATYWPRVNEAALWINWQEAPCTEIIALVRSCNPIAKSGVPTIINSWRIGICDASEVNLQGDASAIAPGTILAISNQDGLIVCCRDGKAVKLEVVYTAEGIFPGHKLAFFGIAAGMVFGSMPTIAAN